MLCSCSSIVSPSHSELRPRPQLHALQQHQHLQQWRTVPITLPEQPHQTAGVHDTAPWVSTVSDSAAAAATAGSSRFSASVLPSSLSAWQYKACQTPTERRSDRSPSSAHHSRPQMWLLPPAWSSPATPPPPPLPPPAPFPFPLFFFFPPPALPFPAPPPFFALSADAVAAPPELVIPKIGDSSPSTSYPGMRTIPLLSSKALSSLTT
mmetsp:Transcript_17141/g.42318  ORF Transcript_17141/g.42318 Transcript_17141/m.42318 type:complete len:208 (+) Transcript_17141:351-974(+)